MKNLVLFAIDHSRNGDSAGFLKERSHRETLSMLLFPRHNSLEITFSHCLYFLRLVITTSKGFALLTPKVICKEYLKVDQALANQFVVSFNNRLL